MWLRIALLAFLLCFTLISAQSQNWTHHIVLDGNGTFHFYWTSPENITGDSFMDFKVELAWKGYFGVGFSPNGGMPGSDIVTGWFKNGQAYFQDRHADAFSLPTKDEQQDYELTNAYENDTFTVFEFRRKLDTCDKNDWAIKNGTVRLIFAYSEEDPENDDPFYHRENRGSKSVILLQYDPEHEPHLNFSSLLEWNIRSPGIDISLLESLYWCKIVQSPEVSVKHQIVYIKAVIQEGHEQFVHHMVLYECAGGKSAEYEDFLERRGYECSSPNVPVEMLRCQELNINWAVGGHDLVMPDDVGFPMDAGPGKFYMFEIHYDNHYHIDGGMDFSGLTFYYTPDVRKYDAAIFTTGASVLPRVFIPPRQDAYIVTGHSHPDCFTSLLPDSGATVLAIHVHSHIIGSGMLVRHFRGNEELPPLYEDKYYDFNYQVYRFFRKGVPLLKNDQITIECTYNSSQRNTTTFGGLSTRNEMCLTHLLYYPRVNRTVAESRPSFASINSVLNINVTTESDVIRVLGSYDWKSVDIAEVQNAMRYSVQETQCFLRPFRDDVKYGVLSYPNDLIPFVPPSTCNATV